MLSILKSNKGNIMILIFIIVPVAIIFMGLVIDMGFLTLAHSETQMIADAGDLAGLHAGAIAIERIDKKGDYFAMVDMDGLFVQNGVGAREKANQIISANTGNISVPIISKEYNKDGDKIGNSYVLAKDLYLYGRFDTTVTTRYKSFLLADLLAIYNIDTSSINTITKKSIGNVFIH